MTLLKKSMLAVAAATYMVSVGASAGISQDQADRLGGSELTPMGAERAGSATGVSKWNPITSPPAGYVEGQPLVDPYATDQVKFEITAANYEQYADNLSPGQIALLKRYPSTFKMDVYESRRSAGYPQSIYDQVKAGATRAELAEGGNGLKEMVSNTPFPIPSSGIEVIWNHIVRYRGGSVKRAYTQVPVQANGNFSMVTMEDQMTFANSMDEEIDANRLFFYKQRIMGPARLEGGVLLVHENIDQVKEPRAAWVYNAGQRRVRRAPDVAYDGPGTASDGLRTADDLDLYNGAPDRYNWKLLGKKELYIGYNGYRLLNKDAKYADILQTGHLNPDFLRYELHRVWVVEGTLKDGSRHVYAKRTFYVDEDTWQIAVADLYDGRGEMWRVKEAHNVTHYQANVPWYAVEVSYDLISGRYLPIGLENEIRGYTYEWDYPASSKEYTPAALRRSGKR